MKEFIVVQSYKYLWQKYPYMFNGVESLFQQFNIVSFDIHLYIRIQIKICLEREINVIVHLLRLRYRNHWEKLEWSTRGPRFTQRARERLYDLNQSQHSILMYLDQWESSTLGKTLKIFFQPVGPGPDSTISANNHGDGVSLRDGPGNLRGFLRQDL